MTDPTDTTTEFTYTIINDLPIAVLPIAVLDRRRPRLENDPEARLVRSASREEDGSLRGYPVWSDGAIDT